MSGRTAGWARRAAPTRPTAAALGVLIVFGAAGLLFAVSAKTARGTQLRVDRTDLAALIRSENAQRDAEEHRLASLRSQIDALTATAAGNDTQVAALRRQARDISAGAGFTPVAGHGLVVTLDDAPADNPRTAGAQPDDLVVHQQDVQAVVNALWAGGAESMMLMDQRVISTSAVRCVGNTLILQGRLYPPPYRISAIGNVADMKRAMNASPTIPIYLEYRDRYGLGWSVDERDLAMPAFGGSLALHFASVPRPSSAASAPSSARVSAPLGSGSAGSSSGSSSASGRPSSS